MTTQTEAALSATDPAPVADYMSAYVITDAS